MHEAEVSGAPYDARDSQHSACLRQNDDAGYAEAAATQKRRKPVAK